MLSLFDSSFFIPSLPLISSVLLGLFLLSFNRTMNRLTKPISFILIGSFFTSTLYFGLLLYTHVSQTFSIQALNILGYKYTLNLNYTESSEIWLIIIGLIAIFFMLASYFRLPRGNGYVRYIISLSFVFSLSFFYVLCYQAVNIFNLKV